LAWIKLDHTTPDKPEIMQIADELGISPEAAFGHLCRVWIWADQQSLNGHAINVTEKGLARVSGHAGMVTAMRKVGWVTGSDGALSLPNFDKHNGETAKKRALATNRKVTQRSRSNSDNSVTREDKSKKEEKTSPPNGGTPTELWNFGVTLFAEAGLKEGTARSFLGSLLRDYETCQVETALRSATGKADPKGYVLGVLKTQPKKGQEKRVPI
jgi:hypothetical protein